MRWTAIDESVRRYNQRFDPASTPTMDYAIVPANMEDAPAIAALHSESWRSAYRGLVPDAFLDGPVIDERLQVLDLSHGSRRRGAAGGVEGHYGFDDGGIRLRRPRRRSRMGTAARQPPRQAGIQGVRDRPRAARGGAPVDGTGRARAADAPVGHRGQQSARAPSTIASGASLPSVRSSTSRRASPRPRSATSGTRSPDRG